MGFIKQHMYHIGMPIIISLIASLLISKIKPPKKREGRTIVDKLSDKYSKFLGWFIDRRWVSSISIILLLLSVVIPAGFVNMDMFPNQEEREINLRYNLNGSFTLDRIKQSVDKVEDYLYSNKEKFEIESVYT